MRGPDRDHVTTVPMAPPSSELTNFPFSAGGAQWATKAWSAGKRNPCGMFSCYYFFFVPHVVSRIQQGRQRESSVKILCSPLSAKFWRHCVLSGRTPRFASTPERRNGNINLSKYFISSSGVRTHNQSVLQSNCALAPRLASVIIIGIGICNFTRNYIHLNSK